MTLANLIKNVNIQGSMTISIWDGYDNEVFRETIHDDVMITINDVEGLVKGLSKLHIKYMYPINDTTVVELYGFHADR